MSISDWGWLWTVLLAVLICILAQGCDSWDGPALPRQPKEYVGIQHEGLCRRQGEAVLCIREAAPDFHGMRALSAEDYTMIQNYIADLRGRCKEWSP